MKLKKLKPNYKYHTREKMAYLMHQAKFIAGAAARAKWKKTLVPERLTIEEFNAACGNVFKKQGEILLDDSNQIFFHLFNSIMSFNQTIKTL